ncbi:MAG: hypothetical protein ISEC1_P1410 [Thiomicrorhabdus sp.]|nr:MAG: hypothetical protein ISEC1_P1410 [Thiomicrorhabdus sp.]
MPIAPSNNELKYYSVWDKSTRLFHWTNVLCVLGLIAVGLVIFNGKVLGVSGEGKILLKTIHVYIGYVFVLNLAWRIIWGFIGNKYARWKSLAPDVPAIKAYIEGTKAGNPPQYIGHNPIAKLMVVFLFAPVSN